MRVSVSNAKSIAVTVLRAATVSCALVISSVGTTSAQSIELGVLTQPNFSPAASLPNLAAAYREVWSEFEAKYPGVKLRMITIRPGPDSLQDVLTMGAARQLPDVGLLSTGWIPRLHISGYLQPLDDVLSAQEKADFLPGFLDAATLDGHLRAIFTYNSWRGLFYSRSAVKALGYEAVPTDWDRFIEFGQAARRAGYKNVLMLPALKSELTLLHLFPQFFGLGGRLYDGDGKPDFFNGPNREKLEKVMQMWRDLVVMGFMPPEVGAMDEAALRPFFYSGETLTVGSSTSFTEQMLVDKPSLKDDLTVSRMPMPIGTTPAPIISNWGYSIFTKDPQRADVARNFIRHMTSSSVLEKLNVVQGHLPIRKSIWERPNVFSQNPLMVSLYKIQNDPRMVAPDSRYPIYPAVRDAISEQMAAVIAGRITPSVAVDRAGASAMAAYQRMQR